MNIKKIFTINHIGLILTLIFGAWAIWATFYDPKPNLEVRILSDINVLDVNENISQMDILLNGNSLKQSNENVKIYTLRMINTGGKDIEIGMFDEDSPICINIKNGSLLEKPKILNDGNEYLKDKVDNVVLRKDNSEIAFPSFILNQDEYIDITLLVLHKNDSTTNISANGRIAGQGDILITKATTKSWDDRIIMSGFIIIFLLSPLGFTLAFNARSKSKKLEKALEKEKDHSRATEANEKKLLKLVVKLIEKRKEQ